MKEVVIYTDGACSGNPGPGGWAALLICGSKRKELSGGFQRTTNNRMEMMAVIESLKSLKEPCRVTLHSDSKYIVDAMMQGWVETWKKNGWKRGKQKEPAKNPDLWQQILDLNSKHDVTFVWVKGHDTDVENNRCDELAVVASQGENLPPDLGYNG